MALRDAEMTCQELVELVTEWLDGTLAPSEAARFDAHLAECPYCRTYIEQLAQTRRALGRLGEADVPAEARAALLAAFRDWSRSR